MIIRINNYKVDATIGVYPHEKSKQQPLCFNIKIYADVSKAAQSDNVNDTVDYAEICQQIDKICKDSKYNLLETMAHDLADNIIQNNKLVDKVKVEIIKPLAVEGADSASVSYKLKRRD